MQNPAFEAETSPERSSGFRIIQLPAVDWQLYKEIRLEALKNEPQAFAATYAEALQKPDQYWIERLEAAEKEQGDWMLLFARKDGRLIGMLGAFFEGGIPAAEEAYLVGMYVSAQARRLGVGRGLLEAILARIARLAHIRRVRLSVNSVQNGAVALYRRLGFEIVKEEMVSFSDGRNDLDYEMVKTLKEPAEARSGPVAGPATQGDLYEAETSFEPETIFRRIPKVELHLHLEGAIPHPALWELCQKYGGDPQVTSLEALREKFVYRDFTHFIDTWLWKTRFLREYEDLTFMAEAVARSLAAQNIRYVEAFYSPPDFFKFGMSTQAITEAIRRGLERAPGIEIALVADLVRDFGPERATVTLSELGEVTNLGVIGVGLGGSEVEYPPEPFGLVFEMARKMGFHTTAHAGEVAGPASIWGALGLQVERIGHATHAEQDPALLAHLVARQIPLEMCPISNACTGSVKRIEDHPVRRFFEAGALVTINTDDPQMFGNSLAGEYRLLAEKFGFSRDEIRTLIGNAVRACWLAEERKARLLQDVLGDPAWAPKSGETGL